MGGEIAGGLGASSAPLDVALRSGWTTGLAGSEAGGSHCRQSSTASTGGREGGAFAPNRDRHRAPRFKCRHRLARAMPVGPLRGFRDYPPPEAGIRSTLFGRMRAAARRAGYQELETPSVENLDLYREKSGEELVQQVWRFVDRGDREVALTPETTPSLARVYAERAKAEPLPVKWFTVSKLWRYEEPQAGRTREFSQFNLDLLGVPGVEAEADLLHAASLVLDAAGAQGRYVFRVNDRPLTEAIARAFGARDRDRYFRIVDQFRKLSRSAVETGLQDAGIDNGPRRGELLRLLDATARAPAGTEVGPLLDRLAGLDLDAEGRQGIERLRRLAELAGWLGFSDRLAIDLTVVRGLAYYSSTVFEAFDPEQSGRALFGGGRYDHLIERYGGPPTPAVGLAIGDQTLELLLRAAGRWGDGEPLLDTYVVAVTSEMVPEAFRLTAELRAAGRSADLDLLGRSLSRQLKEAARRARTATLVGPRELARGVVVVRDLTSGEQQERPRSSWGPSG